MSAKKVPASVTKNERLALGAAALDGTEGALDGGAEALKRCMPEEVLSQEHSDELNGLLFA
jgi:hypothetical protein